jgi:CheY-like chemotaxis protein
MPKLVLIIDDDPAQRRVLAEIVRRLGYATKAVQGSGQALQVLNGPDQGSIALVLLDLVMPGMDGMEVLRRIAPASGGPPVIVQTANGSLDVAKAAMRAGAVDFLVKPTSAERLEISIRSALKIEALQGEISRIKKKAEGTLTFADLVLRAEAMQRVVALGRRAAASNIHVLIEGESGVGKELIAAPSRARASADRGRSSSSVRRPPREAGRKHPVPGTRGARLPARSTSASASSRRPTAARCSSTRSASCLSMRRSSCCAPCMTGRSIRSVPRSRSGSTSASSRRPTGT